MSNNFKFWKLAYERGWCTAEQLKGAVKTETVTAGEISPEQYKEITGIEFHED